MKRKRKLKQWVLNILYIIFFMSIIVAGSDSDSTKVFIIVHLIAGLVMTLTGYIIIKNEI